MKGFRKTTFFLLLGLSILVIGYSIGEVKAQTKPLTYPDIITALNTKLPNNVFKNKVQLLNYLIAQIKQRKVDKSLTADREEDLRQAGATDALIEVISENILGAFETNPAPTPVPKTVSVGVAGDSITNSLGMEFVMIPAGIFMMGSSASDEWHQPDETRHQVTISKPIYIGKYEVTQKQWEIVMGNNPSKFKGCPRCPVESVSWNDVQEYIERLNTKGEGIYRLPTEAEWEYAARAGTTTVYFFGDSESLLGDYAWFDVNSGDKTHQVGTTKPNNWGLYDMHGNVGEWTQDKYNYLTSAAKIDPTGGGIKTSDRVSKDCSWANGGHTCRSAARSRDKPTIRSDWGGFRLVKEL